MKNLQSYSLLISGMIGIVGCRYRFPFKEATIGPFRGTSPFSTQVSRQASLPSSDGRTTTGFLYTFPQGATENAPDFLLDRSRDSSNQPSSTPQSDETQQIVTSPQQLTRRTSSSDEIGSHLAEIKRNAKIIVSNPKVQDATDKSNKDKSAEWKSHLTTMASIEHGISSTHLSTIIFSTVSQTQLDRFKNENSSTESL